MALVACVFTIGTGLDFLVASHAAVVESTHARWDQLLHGFVVTGTAGHGCGDVALFSLDSRVAVIAVLESRVELLLMAGGTALMRGILQTRHCLVAGVHVAVPTVLGFRLDVLPVMAVCAPGRIVCCVYVMVVDHAREFGVVTSRAMLLIAEVRGVIGNVSRCKLWWVASAALERIPARVFALMMACSAIDAIGLIMLQVRKNDSAPSGVKHDTTRHLLSLGCPHVTQKRYDGQYYNSCRDRKITLLQGAIPFCFVVSAEEVSNNMLKSLELRYHSLLDLKRKSG
jgi:hypothetical protein